MMQENALNIYTDGSSFSSPRAGGIGIRFICVDCTGVEILAKDFELPGYKGATNNQMELLACITALDEAILLTELKRVVKIIIYTDSLYVKDNYLRALFNWPKTQWRNQYGKPILNADLWKKFIKNIKHLSQMRKKVDIKWVKGHCKDINNKAVDKMARNSAKMPLNPPLSIVKVRRKQSPNKTKPNSVAMKGQRLSIRIITEEYLKVQKIYKYRYEVISKRSEYYQCVDIIYGDVDLRGTHSYYVSVNDNPNNPTITKVHREIKKTNN